MIQPYRTYPAVFIFKTKNENWLELHILKSSTFHQNNRSHECPFSKTISK